MNSICQLRKRGMGEKILIIGNNNKDNDKQPTEEFSAQYFVTGKGVYLIGIGVHIKIFQEASCKLTEEKIVGVINCPQTPVSVVI